MKIAIGSDHGGFELKGRIIKELSALGYSVDDYGCYNMDSVDYSDYGILIGEKVSLGQADKGIVICSTGIGISISCNKVKNIRCALVSDLESAKLTRLHNDSNVLALAGKMIDHSLAIQITKTWLTTEFEGGRHINRIKKISEYEVNKWEK